MLISNSTFYAPYIREQDQPIVGASPAVSRYFQGQAILPRLDKPIYLGTYEARTLHTPVEQTLHAARTTYEASIFSRQVPVLEKLPRKAYMRNGASAHYEGPWLYHPAPGKEGASIGAVLSLPHTDQHGTPVMMLADDHLIPFAIHFTAIRDITAILAHASKVNSLPFWSYPKAGVTDTDTGSITTRNYHQTLFLRSLVWLMLMPTQYDPRQKTGTPWFFKNALMSGKVEDLRRFQNFTLSVDEGAVNWKGFWDSLQKYHQFNLADGITVKLLDTLAEATNMPAYLSCGSVDFPAPDFASL